MTNKEKELYEENTKLAFELQKSRKNNIELSQENNKLRKIVKLQGELL